LPKARAFVVSATSLRIMPLTALVSQLVYKPNVTINPKDLITQTTAARMRGVSLQAIEGLVRRGRFTVIDIDGHRFLFRDEVKSTNQVSAEGQKRRDAKQAKISVTGRPAIKLSKLPRRFYSTVRTIRLDRPASRRSA
jgi:hypothetical protein